MDNGISCFDSQKSIQYKIYITNIQKNIGNSTYMTKTK